MIYDPVDDRMIIFMGYSEADVSYLFALDLVSLTWTVPHPWTDYRGSPRGQGGQAAVFDPVRDRMVVFGGTSGPNFGSFWFLQWGASVDVPLSTPAPTIRLASIRPNPSSGRVTFQFSIPAGGHTVIEVIDVSGRTIARIEDRWDSAGPHSISWSPADDSGTRLLPGLYFCSLRFGGTRITRKVVLSR